jgi:microcystin-dependent protein
MSSPTTTWLIPPGVIVAYGGSITGEGSPPPYWAYCDGSLVDGSQETYSNLLAVIGPAFGGDGNPYFNLPDFQGYFLRGVDNGSGVDPDSGNRVAGSGGGNSGDNVGSVQYGGVQSLNAPVSLQINPANDGSSPTFGYGLGNIIGGQYQQSTAAFTTQNVPVASGSETRPVNRYVNYIICLGVPMPTSS